MTDRNVAFSSYSTLTRHPLPAIFRDPSIAAKVVPNIRNILTELLAVGRARGFDAVALPDNTIENCIEGTCKLHIRTDSKHRPSMLVDAENNRAIEAEVIFGEVVRIAKEVGVDVPVSRLSLPTKGKEHLIDGPVPDSVAHRNPLLFVSGPPGSTRGSYFVVG